MGGLSAARFLVTQLSRFGLDIIQTDPYVENLAELFSATKRTGVQNIIETNLRSEHGTVIKRPLGTARKFIDFDGLMFISSHFKNQALTHTIPVNTDVVIGPLAKTITCYHTTSYFGYGLQKGPIGEIQGRFCPWEHKSGHSH